MTIKMKAKSAKKGKGLSGYLIDFKKVGNMTLTDVFGKKPVPATMLMKSLWVLIKKHDLKAD